MSRAGLYASVAPIGGSPPADPHQWAGGFRHRGPERATIRAGRLSLVVVSHDPPGDGWSVAEPAPPGWAVAFHGRLAPPVRAPSPAHHAAGLLAARGPEGLRELVGPFALVAHNPVTEEVVVARECLGERPLFVARGDAMTHIGSDEGALLRAPGVSGAVDEWAVATELAGFTRQGAATLHRDVRRVGPGTAEVWSSRSSTVVDLRPPRPAPLDVSAAELQRRYVELVGEVVGDLLPARGPVLCDVSGGLDSSSVAVALVRAVPKEAVSPALEGRAGPASPALEGRSGPASPALEGRSGPASPALEGRSGRSGPAVVALSLVFRGDASADETLYSDAVIESLGLRAVRVRPAPPTAVELIAESARTGELPNAVNQFPAGDLRGLVAEGATRWFGGAAGDDLFYADLGYVVEALRAGRPLEAVRYGRQAARHPAWAAPAHRLLWHHAARRMVRPAVRRLGLGNQPGVSPLVRRAWLSELGWTAPEPAVAEKAQGSAATLYARFYSPDWQDGEPAEKWAAWAGLERARPFLDRRLVELGIAIPRRLRAMEGDPRWLQRGLPGLPPLVAGRTTKAEFSVVIDESVRAYVLAPGAFEGAVDAGWLDSAACRRLAANVARSQPLGVSLYHAHCATLVDAWQRAR